MKVSRVAGWVKSIETTEDTSQQQLKQSWKRQEARDYRGSSEVTKSKVRFKSSFYSWNSCLSRRRLTGPTLTTMEYLLEVDSKDEMEGRNERKK